MFYLQMKLQSLLRLEKQRFGKEEEKKIYIRKRKHYPKIHVWGCFSSKGFGQIVLFRENLTSKKLVDIYKQGLLPSIKVFKGNSRILVEDNDAKHTSKLATSWRENKQ